MYMRRKTARVIVTFMCNRKCPGCCNNKLPEHKRINNSDELMSYEEIVITGGEPMIIPEKIIKFISDMRNHGYNGKLYLYTSLWPGNEISTEILKKLDEFTFTLHAECTDTDIIALKDLSNSSILQNRNLGSRLFIDKRVYERYDLSNINFSGWGVVRKLEWKEKCDPAKNEDLLVHEP